MKSVNILRLGIGCLILLGGAVGLFVERKHRKRPWISAITGTLGVVGLIITIIVGFFDIFEKTESTLPSHPEPMPVIIVSGEDTPIPKTQKDIDQEIPAGSQVSMTVKMGDRIMNEAETYLVRGEETITVHAESLDAGIVTIRYGYEKNGVKEHIIDILGESDIIIAVPKEEPDTVLTLKIEATTDNDDGSQNTITNTGWQSFKLIYRNTALTEVKMGNTIMFSGNKYLVKGRETITIKAESLDSSINMIYYIFEKNGVQGEVINIFGKGTAAIAVPVEEAGTILGLYIEAVADNDDVSPNTITKTGWQLFCLIYDGITLSIEGNHVEKETLTNVEIGTEIVIEAFPSSQIEKVYFSWDDDGDYEIKSSIISLNVPDKIADGEQHTLWLATKMLNGQVTDWVKYYFSAVSK